MAGPSVLSPECRGSGRQPPPPRRAGPLARALARRRRYRAGAGTPLLPRGHLPAAEPVAEPAVLAVPPVRPPALSRRLGTACASFVPGIPWPAWRWPGPPTEEGSDGTY